jgi:phospholipid-binding lipoprotein MlaA
MRPSAAITVMAVVLAGCAAPVPQAINDPDEAMNREIHAFNVGLDKAILRPVATAVGGDGQGPLARGVSNFSDNLGMPSAVLNNVLQLRLGKAAENTVRFGLNTVIGLGGLFDPATALGIPGSKTDFGQTLHIWGVPEGAYVELPFAGPSTTRDTVGLIVDTVIDPLNKLIPSPEDTIVPVAKVASRVGDRARYMQTLDSVLYDSADSYAQARLLYLQNRRFELGQSAGETTFEDPYEDPYAQ